MASNFLDQMADVQSDNLTWFKQALGDAWPAASGVVELCDELLRAMPVAEEKLPAVKVWAVHTMMHNAKRAAASGLLSFGRCQWMEAQPLFRRYIECFGFMHIVWTDESDAVLWFKGADDEAGYEAYRSRFQKRWRKALTMLDPSLPPSFDALSKDTHSSFRSMCHTLVPGGDDQNLGIGVHYFDVVDAASAPAYAEMFLSTVSLMFLSQEAFARKTYSGARWRQALDAWSSARTPVANRWLAADRELRTRYGIPDAR